MEYNNNNIQSRSTSRVTTSSKKHKFRFQRNMLLFLFNIQLTTAIPSLSPSFHPTTVPSQMPSIHPSLQRSITPSVSKKPSTKPSTIPTKHPSQSPSEHPSFIPTSIPSFQPSISFQPSTSNEPSLLPSSLPSKIPTFQPSSLPSSLPSENPSAFPTTSRPTRSLHPSSVPTTSPTLINLTALQSMVLIGLEEEIENSLVEDHWRNTTSYYVQQFWNNQKLEFTILNLKTNIDHQDLISYPIPKSFNRNTLKTSSKTQKYNQIVYFQQVTLDSSSLPENFSKAPFVTSTNRQDYLKLLQQNDPSINKIFTNVKDITVVSYVEATPTSSPIRSPTTIGSKESTSLGLIIGLNISVTMVIILLVFGVWLRFYRRKPTTEEVEMESQPTGRQLFPTAVDDEIDESDIHDDVDDSIDFLPPLLVQEDKRTSQDQSFNVVIPPDDDISEGSSMYAPIAGVLSDESVDDFIQANIESPSVDPIRSSSHTPTRHQPTVLTGDGEYSNVNMLRVVEINDDDDDFGF